MDEISHIEAIETVQMLASADRLRLLRILMRGPATLTQLVDSVGHYPAWVRHHVVTLERAGLVELVEQRKTKGYVEKFYCATARAYAVDFLVLPEEGVHGLLVILGSDDLALDLLADRLRADEDAPDVVTVAMGSLEGLIALRHGLGQVAGCHLLDPATGDFNRSYARALFPGRRLTLMTLAHRQQGLMLPPGNPRGYGTLEEAVAAGARIVNRNRGSGTRVALDRLLAAAGVESATVEGYEYEVVTHRQAARVVADGSAEVALGIYAAAKAEGLDFVPLLEERYDLVTPTSVVRERPARPVAGAAARRQLQARRPLPRRLLDARDRQGHHARLVDRPARSAAGLTREQARHAVAVARRPDEAASWRGRPGRRRRLARTLRDSLYWGAFRAPSYGRCLRSRMPAGYSGKPPCLSDRLPRVRRVRRRGWRRRPALRAGERDGIWRSGA